MTMKSRIQDAYSSFTTSERVIADYFLEHEEEVLKESAKVLAERSKTSPATIVRFTRTLGYSGLPALKTDLLLNKDNNVADLTSELKQGESVSEIVKTTYHHRLQNLDNTNGMVDVAVMERVIQYMEQARIVYLFGIGGSGIVCSDLCQKLNRYSKPSIYNLDPNTQISNLASMTSEDMILLISYSGESKPVLEAAKMAKKVGCKTVGISQLGKTSLSKIVDEMLYLPVQENSIRAGAIASRDASFFMTDSLFLGLISQHLDEAKEKLNETRVWADKIR